MDKGVDVSERLLGMTSVRHKVISSNLANSDTPGYKARDIKFSAFFDDEKLKMETTSNLHFKSGQSVGKGNMTVEETTAKWGDKNNVELDVEVAKMTENALLNQAAGKLVSSKFRMYKSAMKRGQ
ncbi:MAG: flagellar basal body rod protein FlgB [Candidatus Magnetobacterium sp. LHC-1]|uniref:Flagellar basal body rod protein FlgB n=1 Tax=Candidatus Magnetobacterium casense TaxID=1455061 RepID=A0ABS6RUW1_9BACT|nr:flagellar basal body rod protein FlgB [Candidatus Magnetobacterium casensis]MBF0608129.1 flagellar basal body rod protein FlgB [Nitrospirota bacterium]MBV6340135.1 flagellar basal body rod protein FlgB [Candidatus Magnetobacterium casensis]